MFDNAGSNNFNLDTENNDTNNPNDHIEDGVGIAGVPEAVGVSEQDGDDDGGDPVVDIAAEMDARYGPRTNQYNLQPRKQQD